MNSFIQQIRHLSDKFNGIIYDVIFILYSWIYGLLYRHMVSAESEARFFNHGDAGNNYSLFIILSAAVFSEITGGYLIIRRIRHIRTAPGEYPDIIKTGNNYYSEGDSIFFFKLWIAGCRMILTSYIGYITFNALGFGRFSAAGCFLFIGKDIFLFRLFTKTAERPLSARPSRITRYAANVFLAFAGMVFASAGFDAFMSRSYNVLCNFHHWTGAGNFILSLILYFLFFSILYIPTRTMYYAEEIELTDSDSDARALRRSFFITAVLSIFPWLF